MTHVNEQIYVSIRMPEDKVVVLGFLTKGRGSELPYGARWLPDNSGWWEREPTLDTVQFEIDKVMQALLADPSRGFSGPPISWRIIEQNSLPTRIYRNAWRCDDKHTVAHDMPAAREEHKNWIRRIRSMKFAELDGEWMRALGQDKKAEAAAIEAQRQVWRDATADPRIDAAQTVEELRMIVPQEG